MKLSDPDALVRASAKTEVWVDWNIWIDTATKKIQLATYGSLTDTAPASTSWVSMQCIYSYLKEEWKADAELIKFPFPMESITNEQFELKNGWNFEDQPTKDFIRDGWWALKDSSWVSQEEYINLTTLWSFDDSASDLAYYLQNDWGNPTDAILTWEVNQAVRVYWKEQWIDISFTAATDTITLWSGINYLYVWDEITITWSVSNNWTFTIASISWNDIVVNETWIIVDEWTWANVIIENENRDFFKVYLREQGKEYDGYDLLTAQNISKLTYKKYALPLSNWIDLKISETDANIAANAPYTSITLTVNDTAQVRNIGWTDYNFKVIIDWANATAEQIYEKVQYLLRSTWDIDADASILRWDTAEDFLEFVWDTLKTKLTTYGWVYIDNFNSADTNRLVFVDDTWIERTYPYVAAWNIYFNDNLQNSSDAVYRMFFTNDDAWDNTGADFGTANAILVQDASGTDIAWNVWWATWISFDYDYDGNTQRWATSAWTNAPVTLVAIWTDAAQYIKATGTIIKSTQNNFSLSSSQERNFNNPN